MASPDFSQYVDLTVNDLQPTEVYTAAADYARIAIPEFEPRVGSVEDALLQATSSIGAMNLAAINRLPNGLMEGILRLLGLIRREASASTVDVEFTLLTAGTTVPAGFSVVYEVESGDQILQYPFFLETAVTADVGQTTVAATLTSIVVGSIPTITVGTNLLLATTSSNVFSCTTTANVVQGTDEETDAEYLNRGTTYLASLSRTLNTARQIESYILASYPEVLRCKVYDLTYSASNVNQLTGQVVESNGVSVTTTVPLNNAVYDDPYSSVSPAYWRMLFPSYYGLSVTTDYISGVVEGTYDEWSAVSGTEGIVDLGASVYPIGTLDTDFLEVVYMSGLNKVEQGNNPMAGAFTIVILGQNNLPVARSVKKAIYEDILSRTTPGLYVSIIDAIIYDVDITVDIILEAGYSTVSVEDAVTAALESRYSPDLYPNWSDPIGYNEIASIAASVAGVKSVHSVDATIPVFGGNGIIRSKYYGNEALVSIVNATGSDYIWPAFYGTLPSSLVTVNTLSAIPA